MGLILLVLSSFISVQAQTSIDTRMSGSWFDPDNNGEGFVVQILEENQVLVYWFTYDAAGQQRWFTGLGEVIDNKAKFDNLMVAEGPVFGEQFEPEDVELSVAGNLSIEWSDCSSATADYVVDGVSGSQSLIRLTAIVGLECTASSSEPSPMTGSWYDLTHNGEGLVIEALGDDRALVFWFSYSNEGKQAWFYGAGERNQTTITIPQMDITYGGRFGPDFEPGQVQTETWGALVVELDCQYGKLDYSSELPIYGNGKQTLTRLTKVANPECEEQVAPNILLVIADDLGLDASNQYDVSQQRPSTPELDSIAANGLVFDNAWSNPTCSPTRAGILTGKHGVHTGVLEPGDVLSTDETSLQSYIEQHLPGKYAQAVIGKWHLAAPRDRSHPANLGIDHFAGILGGGVEDYQDWTLTANDEESNETRYVTSKLVDLAVEWTSSQQDPWFLWLAFNAPHTPFHLPPTELHNRDLSGTSGDITANPLDYYFAAIEAMDMEIGRLLDSLDEETRDNTIIIFVGDNGTPGQVAQAPFSRTKAKGSLYQGGINIPLFVSGPGVTRVQQRETSLVNTLDLYSTIAALAGVNVDKVHDSQSWIDLHSQASAASERLTQYSEKSDDNGEQWTISDGAYKLIESDSGAQELYQLGSDPFETNDLVGAGAAPQEVIDDLQFLAEEIRMDTDL
jgi:arylsulfatase B